MTFTCPHCRQPMTVLPEHAGTAVVCPGCRATVTPALDLPDEPPPARARPSKPQPANDFDFSEPERPRRKRRRDDDDDDDDRSPRRPWDRRGREEPEKWLMGVASLPMALAFIGGLIGGICGGLAAGLNVTIARNRTIPVAAKLFIFAITTAVASVAYFVIARAVLEQINKEDEPKKPAAVGPRFGPNAPAPLPPGAGPPAQPKPSEKVWEPVFSTLPASAQLDGSANPPEVRGLTDESPAVHALGQARLRLADGPAAPTAGYEFGTLLAVGYADGSTALWNLDRPLATPPKPGPKFPGRVERLWIAGVDRFLVAEVGGKLYVAAAAAPHKALAIPTGEKYGLRLCGFGTAAVVQKVPDGYRTRWLVDAVFDKSSAIPPPGFDKPFFGVERLAVPPAEPQLLTWIHSEPLAILADGRVTRWRGDGTAHTFAGTGKPLAAVAVGYPQVTVAALDRDGAALVRNDTDRMEARRVRLGTSPGRLVIDANGHWLLGQESDGAAVLWSAEPERPVRTVARVEPTPGQPLRPLCEASGWFAVGVGRRVELWHREVLRREADKK